MEKLPNGWIKLTLYDDDDSSNLRSIFFKTDSLSYVYRRKDISGEHTYIHTISQSGYRVCETPEWIMKQISKAEADLPSAKPEQKVGHWIYKDGEMGFGLGAWCCSECGETNESLPFHKCKDPYAYAASKYCACCGTRMEEK